MLSWQSEILAKNYQLDQVSCQRAWVEIELGALAHNVQQIKRFLSPRTELMAVVKADAYGHGAVRVAQTVLEAGCSSLAIATLEEGIELRQAGYSVPILILGAINTPTEVESMAFWELSPTLCNKEQALVFSQTLTSLGRTLAVHLKIDTGMSRLGTLWHEATEFVQLVNTLPHLRIASIYSHLATADHLDTRIMWQQQQRFLAAIASIQAVGIVSPKLHLANSAATLSDRSLHYDLVRVGLALYGLYPAPHFAENVVSLQPVLSVKSKITQIKTLPPGTGVSYGHQFVSDKELKLAVVGIGYADGVPRNLSHRLKVLIRGQMVRQIGTITMDQLMLDVSEIDNLQVGEIVTLIGTDGQAKITVDDWASLAGTISWEILCGFKHRLPRISKF